MKRQNTYQIMLKKTFSHDTLILLKRATWLILLAYADLLSWTGRRSNRHYLCKFLAKMILVILLWHLYVHLFHGHNKWVRKPSCETIQGYISVKYHLTSTLNTNKHLTVPITNSKIRLYLQKLFKISFESSSGSIISLAEIWERSSDRIYGARDDIG